MVDLILKGVWFRSNFKRSRSVLIVSQLDKTNCQVSGMVDQAIVLMVMYVEALTVLIRQENHIRITRLLRPCFFIDTHYMRGVRRYSSMHTKTITVLFTNYRVLRQLFESIKPIVDVLFLLMSFILLFSLLGIKCAIIPLFTLYTTSGIYLFALENILYLPSWAVNESVLHDEV